MSAPVRALQPGSAGEARAALEAMITASPSLRDPRSAAVVQLARMLADQVDAAGVNGMSTRLSAAYLSALKDLRRLADDSVEAPRSASRLALIKREAAGRHGATSDDLGSEAPAP